MSSERSLEFRPMAFAEYSTPNNQMIARMLHLLTKQNRLHTESITSIRKEHTEAYKIDNRMLHAILDQICKDMDFYPYVKFFKSKQEVRGAFYYIHASWLRPNHVNVRASEAVTALQTMTYGGKKKAWNWKK